MFKQEAFQLSIEFNALPSVQSFRATPGKHSFMQSNVHFIAADRSIDKIVDLLKLADVVCPILSCRSSN